MDEKVYSGHIAETKKSSASVGVNSRKVNKSKGIVFLSPLPRCNPPPRPLSPSPPARVIDGYPSAGEILFFSVKISGSLMEVTTSEYKNFMDGLRNLSEHVIVVILFFSRFSSFFALDVEIEELSRWKMR